MLKEVGYTSTNARCSAEKVNKSFFFLFTKFLGVYTLPQPEQLQNKKKYTILILTRSAYL